MSVDAIANATETALSASRLRPELIDAAKEQFDKAVKAVGAAGWHGPTDIETLEGLGGQFLWPEDPFNFRVITFNFDSDKVGFQGRYRISAGIFTVEEGVFHSIPNNPAIGFAIIALVPQGADPRVFQVAGMFTDSDWKIIVILLNKFGASGPIQPPFSAVRMI